jgi:tetratricopeptide (TPR) repeat protein
MTGDDEIDERIARASRHLQVGEVDLALACIEDVLAIEPDHAQVLFMKGCTLGSRGDHAQAVVAYARSAKTAGDRAALPLFNMGNSLQEMGRLTEAMQAFLDATKADPMMADAWINLGRLLDDSGAHQQAIDCYDTALRIEPRDVVALRNRGNSLRALGQFDKALASYDEALKDETDPYVTLVGVSACLGRLGRAEEGLAVLDTLLQHAEDPLVLFEKSVILGLGGRHADALEAIDRAIARGLTTRAIYNNRGEVLAKLERFDDAVASFDTAIGQDSDFAPAWFGKARALFNAGRRADARVALDRYYASTEQPDDLREAADALRSLLV